MRAMTEKTEGRLGYYPDGSTYIVDIPAEHPDTEKPYLVEGMTPAEIRKYNPEITVEESERLAAKIAEPETD